MSINLNRRITSWAISIFPARDTASKIIQSTFLVPLLICQPVCPRTTHPISPLSGGPAQAPLYRLQPIRVQLDRLLFTLRKLPSKLLLVPPYVHMFSLKKRVY
ncbi:hypothetical protein MJO28_011208 [Puccinia striiformis f. sp. tritici]|uniref:Uncharacterized protein n=1 Tax=Puccinia striiformis f. sp. tritici TaxID=168172 RepID=A0ACC0E1G9_9BASI|nr:hypothetical protein MJO28_011208 [Puccinia striiformis f. sp. tritici]